MKDLLDPDGLSLMKRIDNGGGHVQTEEEKSGWGFFTPEISFFLVDFCKEQLTPIQKIIFYSYYVNGMTLKEIGERLQSSHQSVHHKIIKIEKKLRHSWKYMDRWSDQTVTKRVKGKKIKIFNPNSKKEK